MFDIYHRLIIFDRVMKTKGYRKFMDLDCLFIREMCYRAGCVSLIYIALRFCDLI